MKPTVVIGLDQQTARQLLVTAPTWRKHKPVLWQWPWLIFFDPDPPNGIASADIDRLAHQELGLSPEQVQIVGWPFHRITYESQRERMLTGHVFVPPIFVRTEWFVKIDTDAIAVDDRSWPEPTWFDTPKGEQPAVVVASGWNYTKAKGGGGDIHQWAETLESFGDRACEGTERLGLHGRIDGDKIKMPRFASWICFQRTSWVRQAAQQISMACGPYRLPVPSQDTVLWYLAERSGARYLAAKQKKWGWTNVSRIEPLQKKAAEVMGEQA